VKKSFMGSMIFKEKVKSSLYVFHSSVILGEIMMISPHVHYLT
jgi:hypothetical protein